MKIEPIIDINGERECDWAKRSGVMVHRCGINLRTGAMLGHTGADVRDAFLGRKPEFLEAATATGRKNPYTFYLGEGGQVWQALPLNRVGPHARSFSDEFIGVGCIGDFREEEMPPAQYQNLSYLLAGICSVYKFDPYQAVRGHGEVEGAHGGTKAPGEPAACPGDLLKMNVLRNDVELTMVEGARRRMLDAGLIYEA
jgi:hypothetical protein